MSSITHRPDAAVSAATSGDRAAVVDRVGGDTGDQAARDVAHVAPETVEPTAGGLTTGATASEIAAISVG